MSRQRIILETEGVWPMPHLAEFLARLIREMEDKSDVRVSHVEFETIEENDDG